MSQTLQGGILSATYNPLAGSPTTVEYLVVAGGGCGFFINAGAAYPGGGGGAGGLLTAAGFAVTAGSALTITIGAGGTNNVNGSNSVFYPSRLLVVVMAELGLSPVEVAVQVAEQQTQLLGQRYQVKVMSAVSGELIRHKTLGAAVALAPLEATDLQVTAAEMAALDSFLLLLALGFFTLAAVVAAGLTIVRPIYTDMALPGAATEALNPSAFNLNRAVPILVAVAAAVLLGTMPPQ